MYIYIYIHRERYNVYSSKSNINSNNNTTNNDTAQVERPVLFFSLARYSSPRSFALVPPSPLLHTT